jgi:sugar transferase, PEP-CTERM system associated/exopolysaccharide biosynthesis polyprenyl glycosylphosphotransferase
MIADAFICSLIFWFTLSRVFWVPDWCPHDGLLNHVSLDIITLIVVLSLASARLYSYTECYYPSDLLKRIATSFLISLGGIAILGYFAKGITSLDLGFVAPLIVTYVVLYIFRYFLYFSVRDNRTRILILGANDFAREIVRESMGKKFRSYEIVSIASFQEKKLDTNICGIKVSFLKDKVEEAIRSHSVDCIVVTKRNRRGMLPVHELLKCKTQNIRVQEGFSFYEKVKRKIIISEFLQPSWFVFEEGFSQNSIHKSLKRMLGITVSIVLLVILAPIILLVAIGIKLDSPGPVFYRQERVGYQGKVFDLLKFRSMREDAEALNGPMFAQKTDARITRMGKIIRKLRLDEVPQFINIFKGEMDLVGPRPERPVFVKQLEEQVPYYSLRHSVRPGLTGWAQVKYRYGESFKDSKEKLHYDLYYVKHLSWHLDLLIIFLTIKEVLFARGR